MARATQYQQKTNWLANFSHHLFSFGTQKGNIVICHFDYATAYDTNGEILLSAYRGESLPTSQSGDDLTDLGNISDLQFGDKCASLVYFSPESVQGHARPGKSDLFSVGVIARNFMGGIERNPWGIVVDHAIGETNNVSSCSLFLFPTNVLPDLTTDFTFKYTGRRPDLVGDLMRSATVQRGDNMSDLYFDLMRRMVSTEVSTNERYRAITSDDEQGER